jgi:hypothetical protein
LYDEDWKLDVKGKKKREDGKEVDIYEQESSDTLPASYYYKLRDQRVGFGGISDRIPSARKKPGQKQELNKADDRNI